MKCISKFSKFYYNQYILWKYGKRDSIPWFSLIYIDVTRTLFKITSIHKRISGKSKLLKHLKNKLEILHLTYFARHTSFTDTLTQIEQNIEWQWDPTPILFYDEDVK